MSFNLTFLQFMQRIIKPTIVLLLLTTVSCSPRSYGEIPLSELITSTLPATLIPATPTKITHISTPVPTRTTTNIVITATPEQLDSLLDIKKYPLDQVKPSPGEEKLRKAKVFVDSVEINSDSIMTSGALELVISGSLPTPCHSLRADMRIHEKEHQVQIDVYSLAESGKSCIQVLEPFVLQIPVELKNDGNYHVLVNQVEMSQFDWPEQP